jgi:gamma-glutamyl hydrolase
LQVFAGVNGVLIPGGATSIFHSGYASASNALFQLAKEVGWAGRTLLLQANDAGDFFPIWGTCLGFEMMVLMANGGKPYRMRQACWMETTSSTHCAQVQFSGAGAAT